MSRRREPGRPSGRARTKAAEADARLRAETEDLLAALRRVRDESLESDRARNTPGWEGLRAIVDAAITKAEGK